MQSLKIIANLFFYATTIMNENRIYYNGYCPAFKIRDDMFNSGLIEFINITKVNAGDRNIKAYITFLNKSLLSNYIKEGLHFTFGEGDKILGEGIVLKVCD